VSRAASSHDPTRSPNIWDSPDVYEVENRGVDRAGVVEAAMAELHPFEGANLLDIGCGSGFHLPRFVGLGCASVVGVEPHAPLVALARQRISSVPQARVLEGVAQSLPAPDASVDIAHAR
jgi:ubiquinone/menaquinone biosynthesis C-methylase UbiE